MWSAESWSGRAYELREVLGRCALPHTFCLADSDDGRALVAQAGEGAKLPLIVFPDGRVLADPSNAELAEASGSPVNPERTDFDLVIVGAGPAGLSAAVYGASEGFSTLVVDEGGVGGQATSSSLIRNYLGFPRGISGRRLAQQAYQQAWVFGANFAFMQKVTDLGASDDELCRHPLRRRPRARPRRAPRDGRQLPPARRAGAGGAERRRCLLRRLGLRGAVPWPAATFTSSAARTPPDRRRCISLGSPGASRSSPCPVARRGDVALPGAPGGGDAERATSGFGPRSSAVAATAGWSNSCSATGERDARRPSTPTGSSS